MDKDFLKIIQPETTTLVLASGGIDSTAVIHFYKKLKFRVEALFVNYGQASHNEELKAIKRIAKFYEIDLQQITIRNTKPHSEGEVKGRNALLFFLGLLNFRKSNGFIACGLHAGTSYYDCSEDFTAKIQCLFDGYSTGTIKLGMPFLNFSKKEIVDYCKIENIPLHLTYSCESGSPTPCGNCNTCKDLKAIYASQK